MISSSHNPRSSGSLFGISTGSSEEIATGKTNFPLLKVGWGSDPLSVNSAMEDNNGLSVNFRATNFPTSDEVVLVLGEVEVADIAKHIQS